MTTPRRRRHGRTPGLTLVELVVAATLVSLVSFGFAALYGTASSQLTTAMGAGAAAGDALYAKAHVTRTLRNAVEAKRDPNDPSNPKKLNVTYDRWDATTSKITSVTGQYKWDGAATLTWHPDVTNVAAAETVSGAVVGFTAAPGKSVQVDMSVQQGPSNHPQQVVVHTTVQLRGRDLRKP